MSDNRTVIIWVISNKQPSETDVESYTNRYVVEINIVKADPAKWTQHQGAKIAGSSVFKSPMSILCMFLFVYYPCLLLFFFHHTQNNRSWCSLPIWIHYLLQLSQHNSTRILLSSKCETESTNQTAHPISQRKHFLLFICLKKQIALATNGYSDRPERKQHLLNLTLSNTRPACGIFKSQTWSFWDSGGGGQKYCSFTRLQ